MHLHPSKREHHLISPTLIPDLKHLKRIMENWQKQIDEFRPDRVSKSTRTDRRAHTFAQLLTPNRSVSSANWR
jgi:hypothetical protein